MNIIFRVDASIQIGSGHVMRCLTLADYLAGQGANCCFVCRLHSGNMVPFIEAKGHRVLTLPPPEKDWELAAEETSSYQRWLGASIADDAEQTCIALQEVNLEISPDYLVVDHYALDKQWENVLRPFCDKVMVIDDLADRNHDCDILLDQTFGREASDYFARVPATCSILVGSKYALLRPEFAALRDYSIERRTPPKFGHLLITMGGVDKDNATGMVLEALKNCLLPGNCHITVVMGNNAPYLEEVKGRARGLPWPVEVKVNVQNMAQLMADSDLCIGAAGSTSWERCCLGLPTIMLVLAENQHDIAQHLSQHGAVLVGKCWSIPYISSNLPDIVKCYMSEKKKWIELVRKSLSVTDGMGPRRINRIMRGDI